MSPTPDDASPTPNDLRVDQARADVLKTASSGWESWALTERQLCDLEMLASGAFAPLAGFMREVEHVAVAVTTRLPDGRLWPVPVDLAVDRAFSEKLTLGDRVALRDPEGTMLAAVEVTSIFTPNHSDDDTVCLGGPVEAVQLPNQYDFVELRRTPAQARATATASGWARVLTVTTWEPLLRAEVSELWRLATTMGARLMVIAMVGTRPDGALDRFALVRTLQAALSELPPTATVLTLVPMATPTAAPTEQALLEAIVAATHGATHLWGPTDPDAAEALAAHADELGLAITTRPAADHAKTVGMAQVRELLAHDEHIPDAIAPRAVVEELRRAVPPRQARGFTLFFTGLSGSGKSTVANIVATRLRAAGGRKVTLLDGDLVRRHLSSELGFSREHRNLNVLRIGYVASEISRHGGIAVCAPIAPYDDIRRQNRAMIEATGAGFVLVHVATPLKVCEQRDRKGLYAKARAGQLEEFTGISDPYEIPLDADVRIDTTDLTPAESAEAVLTHLREAGWLAE